MNYVLTSQLTITDKMTKEVIHHDSRTQVEKLKKAKEGPYAVAKVGSIVRMSSKFQTVETNIGLDYPVPVAAGFPKTARKQIEAGFDQAYQIVDDEFAKRAKEIEGLLRKLGAKYGH